MSMSMQLAIATVMIVSTREPIPVRMRLMGDVTRAIIRFD